MQKSQFLRTEEIAKLVLSMLLLQLAQGLIDLSRDDSCGKFFDAKNMAINIEHDPAEQTESICQVSRAKT